jgi:hypothetical protein
LLPLRPGKRLLSFGVFIATHPHLPALNQFDDLWFGQPDNQQRKDFSGTPSRSIAERFNGATFGPRQSYIYHGRSAFGGGFATDNLSGISLCLFHHASIC